jgi:23S rRNA pseudouridine2605 synthase
MAGKRRRSDDPQTVRPPRLQKVLALAGYGSRRACEVLILEGRVEIDRKVVVELGTRVDAHRQQVRVDGEVIHLPKPIYFALNKPTGVVTSNSDPARRQRVIDLVPGGDQLFAIGRLDMSSSGLILVTNDGDFANQLAHPRYGIEKTYRVVVVGHPTQETLVKLRRGVHLAEGRMQLDSLRLKSRNKNQSVLQIVLTEGRNREIRRMLAQVGHKVVALHRTGIGPLRLGDLPEGAHRPLTSQEVRRLKSTAATAVRRRPATTATRKERSAQQSTPRAGRRKPTKKPANKPTRKPAKKSTKNRRPTGGRSATGGRKKKASRPGLRTPSSRRS